MTENATIAADIKADRERQWLDDMAIIASMPAGRRFLQVLIFDPAMGAVETVGFNDAPVFPVSNIKEGLAAALHQAHHDGRRSLGCRLLRLLEQHQPDALCAMRIEAAQEQLAQRRRLG